MKDSRGAYVKPIQTASEAKRCYAYISMSNMGHFEHQKYYLLNFLRRIQLELCFRNYM